MLNSFGKTSLAVAAMLAVVAGSTATHAAEPASAATRSISVVEVKPAVDTAGPTQPTVVAAAPDVAPGPAQPSALAPAVKSDDQDKTAHEDTASFRDQRYHAGSHRYVIVKVGYYSYGGDDSYYYRDYGSYHSGYYDSHCQYGYSY